MTGNDIYKAPSFQFYPNDFLSDTMDLDVSEIGSYVRLLCWQWKNGSIPASVTDIARIVGVPPKQMTVIWKRVARFYVAHPSIPDCLIQRRLEEVRQKALENYERRANAGHFGGKAKAKAKSKQNPSNATAMPGKKISSARFLLVAKAKQKLALRSSVFGLRSSTEQSSDIHFAPNLEKLVAAYLAILAEDNTSGKITAGRVRSVRAQLAALRDEIGNDDAFAYGLGEATARGAANANYVKKAAQNFRRPPLRAVSGAQPSAYRELT